MSFFSKIFGKTEESEFINPVKVDFHSHLLPGLDDGVESYEESLRILEIFNELGYQKIITTPHVMGDTYQNTPSDILSRLDNLRNLVKEKKINIEVEAAAEYYLDESIIDKANNRELLTFGNNYVLVETSFTTENDFFDSMVFTLKVNGYNPIIAHPERYFYMYDQPEKYKAWKEREIFFQLNVNSLTGYYSKQTKKIAEMLIKNKLIDFVGSDLHHKRHFGPFTQGLKSRAYRQLTEQGVLNNTLL
jgi:tyrosine-protein phosphatase YwqE